MLANWLIHHQAGPIVTSGEMHFANVLDACAVDAIQPDTIADDKVFGERIVQISYNR